MSAVSEHSAESSSRVRDFLPEARKKNSSINSNQFIFIFKTLCSNHGKRERNLEQHQGRPGRFLLLASWVKEAKVGRTGANKHTSLMQIR